MGDRTASYNCCLWEESNWPYLLYLYFEIPFSFSLFFFPFQNKQIYLESHRGRRSELWKRWASWAAWARETSYRGDRRARGASEKAEIYARGRRGRKTLACFRGSRPNLHFLKMGNLRRNNVEAFSILTGIYLVYGKYTYVHYDW